MRSFDPVNEETYEDWEEEEDVFDDDDFAVDDVIEEIRDDQVVLARNEHGAYFIEII